MQQPWWVSVLLLCTSFVALRQAAPDYFLTGVCAFTLISLLVVPFTRRRPVPAKEPVAAPPTATDTAPAEADVPLSERMAAALREQAQEEAPQRSPPAYRGEARRDAAPTIVEQHAFADAAKRYDLPAVRALIEANSAYVNVQPVRLERM